MLVVYKYTIDDFQIHPVSRNQNQSIPVTVSIAADKFDFKTLCNYGAYL